jgi:hypothetical protein
MKSFSAKIQVISINPYVLLPATLLKYIFQKVGKNKGAIPVKLKVGGHSFIQNLVKYSGKWRLYLNGPMRKAAAKDVGDTIDIKIDYDPAERTTPIHPRLRRALKENKEASASCNKLGPSRQKEILGYINNLKSEESLEKNIKRTIAQLTGEQHMGRVN